MLSRVLSFSLLIYSFESFSEEVSIFDLLVNPDVHVGKEIEVTGYLTRDNFLVLYPYEVDATLNRKADQILVDAIQYKIPLHEVKCLENYSKIKGTVYSLKPIVLTDIKWIKRIEKKEKQAHYTYCWKKGK